MRGAKPPSEQTSVRRWSVSAKPQVLEFGMGVDVHGGDGTKAACRAVSDAIRHSSLPLFHEVRERVARMLVDMTVASAASPLRARRPACARRSEEHTPPIQ